MLCEGVMRVYAIAFSDRRAILLTYLTLFNIIALQSLIASLDYLLCTLIFTPKIFWYVKFTTFSRCFFLRNSKFCVLIKVMTTLGD